MYHRRRKKMSFVTISAILLFTHPSSINTKSIETTTTTINYGDEGVDNNIVDFDEEYSVKYNEKYGGLPWQSKQFNRETHRYSIIRDTNKNHTNVRYNPYGDDKTSNTNSLKKKDNVKTNDNSSKYEESTTQEINVIPLELLSTTEDALISILESTTEQDLTVIPISTTVKLPSIKIDETVTIPMTSTENDVTTEHVTTEVNYDNEETINIKLTSASKENLTSTKTHNETNYTTTVESILNHTEVVTIERDINNKTNITEQKEDNASTNTTTANDKEDTDVPIFTELDTEVVEDIPEDYYDSKDVLPTSPPKTDALSVLFGLAGSVVESVAVKVVPKSIYDLFKRMQRQNEALEAERLRSREENGGLGQFGRGILKTLSTGLSKPLSQLMAGVKEAGSLDTDRGFVANVASSVTSMANVANGVLDAFKDRVQAIYPGTVWCGDGRSAQARSSDLGLFFFTDTCCRQHDACKLYIRAGDTKYGLTNTGLFTRSHCSCDTKFRECLRKTNSLVSAQIGLTYFNVLGPQCFRRAHPIVKCMRRTRITGQKCEEYELDYTKPRMWQWFDNETF